MKEFINQTLDLPMTKYILLCTLCLIILSFFFSCDRSARYEFLDSKTRINKSTNNVEHYQNAQYGNPGRWETRQHRGSMQLELFCKSETELLRDELKIVRETTDNVRRGIFKRFDGIMNLVLTQQQQIEELKQKIGNVT